MECDKKAVQQSHLGIQSFCQAQGTGGHCIPSIQCLSWKAKTKNYFSRFIDLSTDINQNMPNYVFEKFPHI